MTAQLDATVKQGRVDVDGLDTYYEIHGEGEPLLYLHGGFNPIDMFNRSTPVLAEQYRLYMPERQGQGRTPDRDGPITYESWARDTIAFCEAVGLSSTHLAGFSDGAVIAAHVALERPDLVRKLILIGNYMNPDGCTPFYADMIRNFTADSFPAMFREMWEAYSPDPAEHFEVVFNKLKGIWLAPGISLERLGDVQSPTLVVIADNDCVTVEHAAAMVRVLPQGSQLAVVPGTSHGMPYEKPDHLNRLILEFLSPDQVEMMIAQAKP